MVKGRFDRSFPFKLSVPRRIDFLRENDSSATLVFELEEGPKESSPAKTGCQKPASTYSKGIKNDWKVSTIDNNILRVDGSTVVYGSTMVISHLSPQFPRKAPKLVPKAAVLRPRPVLVSG